MENKSLGLLVFTVLPILRPVLRQLEWGRTFAKQPTVVQSALAHARAVQNSEEFLALCGSLANVIPMYPQSPGCC